MASTDDLQRVPSNKSLIGQHDGHVDGYLNCVALRHGWSRKFSISPIQLATLDYATLEAILELNTLKLRTSQLRIFIENPPESGTFSKVRFWKNDTSLQSVLIRNFFEARMRTGIVVTLDIRDGHDREDTQSIKSGINNGSHIITSSLSRTGASTKDWLRRRGLNRSTSNVHGNSAPPTPNDDEDEDGEPMTPPQPQPPPAPLAQQPARPSRAQALMYFLGFSSKPPQIAATPKTDEEIAEEQRAEEAVLRKRGWLPPVIRRIASRRSQRSNNSTANKTTSRIRIHPENPFFSASERNLSRPRTRASVQTQEQGSTTAIKRDEDGEEMEVVVVPGVAALEAANNANDMIDQRISGDPSARATPQPTRWLRFRGSSTDVANGSPDKGKQKQNALTGATIVRKPMDAFKTDPGNIEL
ncbi:hypothetical protein AX16_007164 [Volvariella volvacea WC 439]|nr:hypothetical protein AX16_007164 [Volvariella volvacea WC 439]